MYSRLFVLCRSTQGVRTGLVLDHYNQVAPEVRAVYEMALTNNHLPSIIRKICTLDIT